MPSSDLAVQATAKQATAVFLIGWGIGGLLIGAAGDRYGRARFLTISVLVYSLCSAVTAVVHTPGAFILVRFCTGLGIGGVFGLAVTILSEAVRGAARLKLLALLQVLSTVGNLAASLIKMRFDGLAAAGAITHSDVWRGMFLVGAVPILLALISAIGLRESAAWVALRNAGALPAGPLGAYREILAAPRDRRHLLIGTVLAVSGVVGLWAIGEYAVDLQDALFTAHYRALHVPDQRAVKLVADAKNWAFMLQMAGGAAGMYVFSILADRLGRRPVFIGGFAAAFAVTAFVYGFMTTPSDAYWMMPLMGAAQFALFAGFSIYLPELFGPRVRGTGVSFCYNIGRFAAALGGFGSALLTTRAFGAYPMPLPLRFSALLMCGIFLIGMIAAWQAPETKGAEHDD